MVKQAIFLFLFFLGAFFPCMTAEPVKDKHSLLDFIKKIHHSHSLNWSKNTSVCSSWIGVTCSSDNSSVVALELPGVGITGSLPLNTLTRLSALQVLSLRSNGISGSFPGELSHLKNLISLYFQFNQFSGPLPDLSAWNNLTVVDLSNNGFNGSIPPSILSLTHLTSLNLSNNSLSGEIPDLNISSLQQLNLANNRLTGPIPRPLQRFPSSSFAGNRLESQGAMPPSFPVHPPIPQPLHRTRKLGEPVLLGIIIGCCILVFVLAALLIVSCYSKGKKKQGILTDPRKKEASAMQKVSRNHEKENKLVFFEGCSLAFDLEDLLRASAEVLGKGTFGVTYKAALEDSTTVAVKRLKEVSAGKREFSQHMEIVGNIKHENVIPIRVYYYSKKEKLTVCDYYDHGSVTSMLHAQRGEGRIPLDWGTRLRIAIGAAKGIAHIHTENGGKLVHGNIKASNILLNSQGYGCISDTGLATVMSSMPPPTTRAAEYRAPEVTDSRKATQAADTYSFGVFLLELLTGKSPIHSNGGEDIHLVRWVNSVVREEWTAEVFDLELLRFPNIEEEMVEMLQIGMSCVARIPEQRPSMAEVVKMVEDVRRVNAGNESSSETKQVAAEAGTSSSVQYLD